MILMSEKKKLLNQNNKVVVVEIKRFQFKSELCVGIWGKERKKVI